MRQKPPHVCGRRRTVLVLDDEPIVLQVLSAALSRNGFAVLTAETAQEAGRLFEAHAPTLCLAIVDIALTDMTGDEFVNSLPTLTPRIPILFITGLGDFEVEGRLPRDCAVLHKPFTADYLMHAISAILSGVTGSGLSIGSG